MACFVSDLTHPPRTHLSLAARSLRHHGGMAQFLRTPMGGTEVGPIFIGGSGPPPLPPKKDGGRGRGTGGSPYPHPHGAQIAFGFAWQKGPKKKIIPAVSFFGYPMGFPNAEGDLCMPISKVSCSRFWPISFRSLIRSPLLRTLSLLS